VLLRARYGVGKDWKGNDVRFNDDTGASAAENARLREN